MNNESGIMNISLKQKGFTLLEVLIASALFAMVMVMTTGTIASSSSYQSKLKAMRETGEESRRLADMLTNDIRSASQPVTFTINSTTYNFKNGLAFLKWNGVWNSRYDAAPSVAANDANVLIIATKDSYIIYSTSLLDNRVCYQKLPSAGITPSALATFISNLGACGSYITPTDDAAIYLAANRWIVIAGDNGDSINNNNTDTRDTTIKFGGFLPSDAFISSNPTLNQQPYVQFDIISETKSTDVQSRSKAEIKSTVTSRSYNQ